MGLTTHKLTNIKTKAPSPDFAERALKFTR